MLEACEVPCGGKKGIGGFSARLWDETLGYKKKFNP